MMNAWVDTGLSSIEEGRYLMVVFTGVNANNVREGGKHRDNTPRKTQTTIAVHDILLLHLILLSYPVRYIDFKKMEDERYYTTTFPPFCQRYYIHLPRLHLIHWIAHHQIHRRRHWQKPLSSTTRDWGIVVVLCQIGSHFSSGMWDDGRDDVYEEDKCIRSLNHQPSFFPLPQSTYCNRLLTKCAILTPFSHL